MFEKITPRLNHWFCRETQENSGLMGLTYLDGALKKWKCIGCPNKGTTQCGELVKNSLEGILSPKILK